MKPGVCVFSPDPTPKRRQSVFWGLLLNTNMPIRFMPCGLHVIIMRQCTTANFYCVWPCQNNALSWRSHDMLHPVRPKKQSMCLLWGCDYNTVWRVIFVGSNFRWKSEIVLKINFCAFKFHDSNQSRGVALLQSNNVIDTRSRDLCY